MRKLKTIQVQETQIVCEIKKGESWRKEREELKKKVAKPFYIFFHLHISVLRIFQHVKISHPKKFCFLLLQESIYQLRIKSSKKIKSCEIDVRRGENIQML